MEIDITSPEVAFEAHINPIENKRILFSGPFGIGKTYFLEKFFEKRSEYFVVKISPINYVLGSNADVFELLKYDVLHEILCSDKMIVDEDMSLVSREDMPPEVFKTIKDIALGMTVVGKTIIDIPNKIVGLQKKLIQIEAEINKSPGYEKIKDLITAIEESKFILKADYLTGVINRSLEELKENNPNIKRILIIDDIDRIDPEHIFRLFNVFGAHFPDNNAHKFEFDKVIFVCDINNIRSVFAAKYGLDADFNGYIDKFYSEKIFSFSNKSAVVLWLKQCKVYFGHDSIKNFIIDLFSFLIFIGILNLRELRKIENVSDVSEGSFGHYLPKINNVLFFYAIKMLEKLLGSTSVLIDKLNLIASNQYYRSLFREHDIYKNRGFYFSYLFYPIIGGSYKNYNFPIDNIFIFIPDNEYKNYNSYELKIDYEGFDKRVAVAKPNVMSKNPLTITDIDAYFWLVKEAVAIAKYIG